MKKTISFVNPNFNQGPKEFNAHYLPYSTGILWSYLTTFPHLMDHYELGEFIWRREEITNVVERLKNNYMVGFSTYIWNRNYNYTLAKKLKEANPDIITVFGGPEVAIESPSLYEKHPYIDVTVIREGEIIFKELLEANSREDWPNIKGLVINDNGKAITTGYGERISDLNTIPSPYLSGLFDDLMSKHTDVRWNAILETNRGCPYQCTFCDWGSLTYSKVKLYDEERVKDELEWVGSHGLDFISFTDANFGIFEERDSRIADKLIEIQQKYDNPKHYTLAWAKNQKRSVVDIAKKLIYQGGTKIGLNLSVQSLDQGVLGAIRRKNLAMNQIEEVFDMCEKNGIPLYTELILGLPEETLETFKETFYKLYRAKNHTGITVYQAQLLENAEMSLKQREEYEIVGAQVYDYLVGTYNENEVRESIEVVVSTKNMNRDKMIEAQLWAWFMNTFHINGLTNYISRYLVKKLGIDYADFYEKLWKYLPTNEWLQSEMDSVAKNYTNWTTIGKTEHPPVAGVEIHGWNIIHSTIIKMHLGSKQHDIFKLIEKFVSENYTLDTNELKQLIDFQKNYVVDYEKISQYPIQKNYDYNFLGYLVDDTTLNEKTTYTFDFTEDKTMSLQRFCENIYLYRRRNFGKAWISPV